MRTVKALDSCAQIRRKNVAITDSPYPHFCLNLQAFNPHCVTLASALHYFSLREKGRVYV